MSSPNPPSVANGLRKRPTQDDRDPRQLGVSAIRPVEYHGWNAFSRFCYNPDDGAICSRTPKSWFLVVLYYFCFLLCLSAFFFGLMQLFFLTLTDSRPKYMGNSSLIGTNPGLGMRPGQAESRIASGLFRLDRRWNGTKANNSEEASNAGYAARLEKFYIEMKATTDVVNGKFSTCNESELNVPREPDQLPCARDLSFLGNCTTFPYGYAGPNPEPCFIIKVNKIFGFTPTPLDADDVSADETCNKIPQSIKEKISEPGAPPRVYINCDGVKLADQEALKGVFKYFPEHQGVPIGHFPHQNIHGPSPMIGVKMVNLPRGQTIHTECKVYFKGVQHDSTSKVGLVKFDILIDD